MRLDAGTWSGYNEGGEMSEQRSLLERFLEKVHIPSGSQTACWEWAGTTAADGGYGQIHEGGEQGRRLLRVHRYAWSLANGDIPSGFHIRHRCDNPACVRPSHLELGTIADNNRDQSVRNRTHKSAAGLPFGVYRHWDRWGAHVWNGEKMCDLGTFNTIEEAAEVAMKSRIGGAA